MGRGGPGINNTRRGAGKALGGGGWNSCAGIHPASLSIASVCCLMSPPPPPPPRTLLLNLPFALVPTDEMGLGPQLLLHPHPTGQRKIRTHDFSPCRLGPHNVGADPPFIRIQPRRSVCGGSEMERAYAHHAEDVDRDRGGVRRASTLRYSQRRASEPLNRRREETAGIGGSFESQYPSEVL